MELELYDCHHCLTSGVLATTEGKCPSCKRQLKQATGSRRHSYRLRQRITLRVFRSSGRGRRNAGTCLFTCSRIGSFLRDAVFSCFC